MFDKKLIWAPFTQEKTALPPLHIVRGEGAYLYGSSGEKYLDLISSWWVNLHGHAHPEIALALYEQAMKLEHVIFAGFTHEAALGLCSILKEVLPGSLSKFFFSDNGSTAVEVALKMAYQFWRNSSENKRNTFLSFEEAYHGDTFGAMSVGKGSKFHSAFEDLLFDVETIPYPETWNGDTYAEEKEERVLQQVEQYLVRNGDKVAAFITEPLIQGAGGMRCVRPSFLNKLIKQLRRYDILIIFDEVMSAFGRTGTLFAAEQVGLDPDIICLAKGLTGGFLPLALTVTSEAIYEAFLGDDFSKALAHGHSYTANPLGCAAAIASLKLLLKEETQKKIQLIAQKHTLCLAELTEHNRSMEFAISAPRQVGTIAAFNLGSVPNYHNVIGSRLKKIFLDCGLVLRPLGNVIYLLPPYCISLEDLQDSYEIIGRVLREL